jgi:hypothetical protein
MLFAARAGWPSALLIAVLALLAPRPTRASDSMDRTIVVLPIDTTKTGARITQADRVSLEEMLRDEAIDALQPLGWKVLSSDNTIQLLQDNGIDPSKCDEGSCQLGVARQMTVPMFVSGAIQYTSDGAYTASFRLNDTKSGTPLVTKHLESSDLRGLREQFHKQAADFFSRAPALRNSQNNVVSGREQHLGGKQEELKLGEQKVIVDFDSAPQSAVVLVDGQVLCQSTPCRKTLAPGGHSVSIQKDGYEPAETQLVAKKGAAVSLTLARISARVTVETTPPGLAIRIDGRAAGTSPIDAQDMVAGPHEFLVSDPCYVEEGDRAVLKKGEDRTVRISPAQRLAGISVSAEDEKGNALEARVLVDGREVGSTPGSFKVSACSKKLELSAGELIGSEALSLSEGKIQAVRARLSRPVAPTPPPAPVVQAPPAVETPSGPGFWSDRKTVSLGLLLGTGAADFQTLGTYGAQTGWNWTAQIELSVLEMFVAQAGGNAVSLNDANGDSSFIYGATGALGVRPLRETFQPFAMFRYSAWGSSASGAYLEGGLRIAGSNIGMDFSVDYGLTGPVNWLAMVSIVYLYGH